MNDVKTKILIVDDRRENLIAVEAVLADLDLDIYTATSGNEALASMFEHDFAVVLMDVQMPEMDGFETVELMKQSRRTRDIPVLYLTAISKDAKHVFKGYEVGAVDYIFKPIEPIILRSKVHVLVALHQARAELEERNRQLEEMARKLEEAAMTDELTGLYNRRFLQSHIDKDAALVMRVAWNRERGVAHDENNRHIGFLMIDVDYFKRVNDNHGHDAGDVVLVRFAQVLREAVRGCDEVIRWGGEEFLVLLRQSNCGHIGGVAERIRKNVAGTDFETPSGETLRMTCSVGYCCYPLGLSEEFNWQDTVSLSDAALVYAKEHGRNRAVGVSLAVDTVDASERRIVLHDLATALDRGYLRLHQADYR